MNKVRPRFSLLTLLLLGTIAALAVTLWRSGNEVVPLRTELMDLRKQLGYFPIEDSDRIAVREADVVTSKAWCWQMFLPVQKDFSLHYLTGTWQDVDLEHKSDWLQTLQGRGGSFSLPNGKFRLDVSFEEIDGDWFFRHSYHSELQSSSVLKASDNWLRDLLVHERFSEANTVDPVSLDPNEPVILLHVRRSKTTRAEDGKLEAERTGGPTESVLVWITGK